MAGNTIFCWPEGSLHGTTALPSEGVTCNFSQNLAKRTVTAIKKWREGTELPRHKDYRLNQLEQDPIAREALIESEVKNGEKRKGEIIMAGNKGYEGNHVNIDTNDREWV